LIKNFTLIDCHRPWVLSKCNECNAEIGGLNHKSAQGNIKLDEMIDKTIKGYSLPKASDLNDLPITERLLNSYEFQIERFFLHACLYLACGDTNEISSDVHEIMKLAKPYLKKEDIKQFFWDHMHKDLKITCSILNLTVDELIILLHLITFGFMKQDSSMRSSTHVRCSFESKQERQNWEDLFNRTYLSPFLSDIKSQINKANNDIQSLNQINGNGTQQSKIYFMAYELLKEPDFKTTFIYENETFWKFRAMITFDLMANDLKNDSDLSEQFKILKKFNELKTKLKLVAFNLPSIMKMINFLRKNLFKSYFKYTAQNKTIGQYLDEIRSSLPKDWTMNKIKQMIDSFQLVWTYAKLNSNEFIRNNSILTLNTEFEVSLNSKLSYFLPTLNGDGLFSYSLIQFLSSIQNEMITYYHEIKRFDSANSLLDSVSIELFENPDLIIKFDENNDLFRLVHANFWYDSKNLKCVYKFKNIENQIINRYLRAKPKINLQAMELFEYSDEINDFSIFKRIENNNNNNSNNLLDINTQIEIIQDFKKINEISEALNTLKVIMNYASTLSTDSREKISSFVRKIYYNDLQLVKESEQILKEKIIEKCQVEHLKNVWIILMMKRCVLYTINNQDPYDYLNSAFKSTEEIELFDLNHLLDSNSLLVSVLVVVFQIITFDLSFLHSEEEIGDKKGQKIRDIFKNLDACPNFLIPTNLDKLPQSFPDYLDSLQADDDDENNTDVDMNTSIKLENIYEFWKLLCKKIR